MARYPPVHWQQRAAFPFTIIDHETKPDEQHGSVAVGS